MQPLPGGCPRSLPGCSGCVGPSQLCQGTSHLSMVGKPMSAGSARLGPKSCHAMGPWQVPSTLKSLFCQCGVTKTKPFCSLTVLVPCVASAQKIVVSLPRILNNESQFTGSKCSSLCTRENTCVYGRREDPLPR